MVFFLFRPSFSLVSRLFIRFRFFQALIINLEPSISRCRSFLVTSLLLVFRHVVYWLPTLCITGLDSHLPQMFCLELPCLPLSPQPLMSPTIKNIMEKEDSSILGRKYVPVSVFEMLIHLIVRFSIPN